jgi:hypothetical protein
MDLDQRLHRDLERCRQRYPHLDEVVVAGPDLDDFLSRNACRIALFVAPQRQNHELGTVLHPSAESAIRLLACPLIICTGVQDYPNAAPVTSAVPHMDAACIVERGVTRC